LNQEFANAEVQHAVAAAAGATSGQQPHILLAPIPDPEKFDSSHEKGCSFISHLQMKLAGNAAHFLNP
jgi:hypothetical protein